MTPSKELLFRLLMISVGVFVFARYILPMLWQLVSDYFGSSDKKKGHDLDMMIEGQKQMLRSQMGVTGVSEPTTSNRKISASQEFYKQAFLEASKKGSSNAEDLKNILSLWDAQEWGVSEKINQLAQKISRSLGLRIEANELLNLIKFCDRRELWLPPPGSLPLSFKDITASLESFAFAHQFLFGDQLDAMARTHKASKEVFKKCRDALGPSLLGENLDKTKIAALSSKNSWQASPADQEILLIKWIKTKKGLKSRNDLESELMPLISFFQTLLPIAPVSGNKDIDGALAIFSADQNTPIETIKKRYKKMAIERHPDKLKSLGIPSEFEKIATENFAQIQMAYNIVMQHKKE